MSTAPLVTLTTIANFPKHHMLENLAVRSDGSILVVASPQREVWYVPAPGASLPVEPVKLHTFEEGALAQSLLEVEPDIFLVSTYGKPALYRFDLRGWKPGTQISPTKVLDLEPPAGPNGCGLLGSGVMVLADCVEGLIWRIDVSDEGRRASARVWLKHHTMDAGGGHPDVKFSETQHVPFPGINGLKVGLKTKHVYYTTSSQNLFMRVAFDPATLKPAGEPEFLGEVLNGDDLCLDENAGVAYIARHPDHIIERVPLGPGLSKLDRTSIAGKPFNEGLIGPTSLDWGRAPEDYGKVAYVPSDGGVIHMPPDGVLRPARLMRVEFPTAE